MAASLSQLVKTPTPVYGTAGLPEGRHVKVDNKNFYFDIGQNNRGVYMRISEVKSNFRTAITIPEKSWGQFRDIFDDFLDKMKHQDGEGGGGCIGDSTEEGSGDQAENHNWITKKEENEYANLLQIQFENRRLLQAFL